MPSPASATQSSQSDPSCWSDGDGGGDGGALLLVAAVGPVGGATVGVGGVVDFVPGGEVVVSSDGVSVEPSDVVASVGVSVVLTGPAVRSDVGFAVDVGSEEVEGSSDVFVTSVGRDSAVLVESVVTGLAELVGDVELVAGVAGCWFSRWCCWLGCGGRHHGCGSRQRQTLLVQSGRSADLDVVYGDVVQLVRSTSAKHQQL